MSELLRARDVHKTYYDGGRKLEVVRGVDLSVRAGEVLAIMGPSGAGKSTLLHILGALDRPTQGDVEYGGVSFKSQSGASLAEMRNREFGFVFQFFHLLPDLNALENVLLAAMIGTGYFSWFGRRGEAREQAARALDQLGMGDRLLHKPAKLSGGERQRVAIARALMNNPRIVFCDEPTGNLDTSTSSEIFDLIDKLNAEENQTFVIVTHNDQLAERAGRVLHIVDGRFVKP